MSVVVRHGPAPTLAAVRRGTTTLRMVSGPTSVRVSGAPAVRLSYTTVGLPDPVTGKRLVLVVDRYYLWHGGRVGRRRTRHAARASTTSMRTGLMAESFRWR